MFCYFPFSVLFPQLEPPGQKPQDRGVAGTQTRYPQKGGISRVSTIKCCWLGFKNDIIFHVDGSSIPSVMGVRLASSNIPFSLLAYI